MWNNVADSTFGRHSRSLVSGFCSAFCRCFFRQSELFLFAIFSPFLRAEFPLWPTTLKLFIKNPTRTLLRPPPHTHTHPFGDKRTVVFHVHSRRATDSERSTIAVRYQYVFVCEIFGRVICFAPPRAILISTWNTISEKHFFLFHLYDFFFSHAVSRESIASYIFFWLVLPCWGLLNAPRA